VAGNNRRHTRTKGMSHAHSDPAGRVVEHTPPENLTPEPISSPKREENPEVDPLVIKQAADNVAKQDDSNPTEYMLPPDKKIIEEIKRVTNPPPKVEEIPKFRKKFFVYMLGLSALTVAVCAAFFSVRGISLLFSGSMLAVVIMASGLEYGKLVAASYLYRYWKQTNFLLKGYLMVAVLVLVGITSLGIYGFLSDAFEKTKTEVALYETQIENAEENNAQIDTRIAQVRESASSVDEKSEDAVRDFKQIYDDFISRQATRRDLLLARIVALDTVRTELEAQPGGLFSSKKKKLEDLVAVQAEERSSIAESLALIEAENKKEYDSFLLKVDSYKEQTTTVNIQGDLDVLYTKLDTNSKKVLELKRNIANTDIGSFKFIARAFDVELDTVVKWFILCIVVVFDPLSVCLILAYNTALKKKEDD
jgi:hypothetical protein